jgi:hypothetical protein
MTDTTTRDPRVDPRPGDVLRVTDAMGLVFERSVGYATGGIVEWVSGRIVYAGSLKQWRAWNATAEIGTVAE